MGRGLSRESRDLIARAYDVLEREHPSGVRRVCYAIFGNQAGDWVKKVGKLLTRARKDGVIPWDWIADESRPELLPFVVEDSASLLSTNRQVPDYDPWLSQPAIVLVWSEKSVGGTLKPVLDAYHVPFQVQHGHTSTTVIRQLAVRTQNDPRGRRLEILWVGDHDASGLDMSERDAPKRLAEYGLDPTDFAVTRVAITRSDATSHALQAYRDPVKEHGLAGGVVHEEDRPALRGGTRSARLPRVASTRRGRHPHADHE